MTKPFLSSDDLPPSPLTDLDDQLRRKLEEAISRYFYESCNGVIQALLTNCEWYFTVDASALMLVINCSDAAINARVSNNLAAIINQLVQFAARAKIRICPPIEVGLPFERLVDETSAHRDLF